MNVLGYKMKMYSQYVSGSTIILNQRPLQSILMIEDFVPKISCMKVHSVTEIR